jgi:hypothetical protein
MRPGSRDEIREVSRVEAWHIETNDVKDTAKEKGVVCCSSIHSVDLWDSSSD